MSNRDINSVEFKNLCRQANIEYTKARMFRHRHPELLDSDVIKHFQTLNAERIKEK